MRNKNLRNKTEQKIVKVIRVPRNNRPVPTEQTPRNKPTKTVQVKVTIPYRKVGGEVIQIDHSWIEERFRKNEERWQKKNVTEKTYKRNIEKFNNLKRQLFEEEKKLNIQTQN